MNDTHSGQKKRILRYLLQVWVVDKVIEQRPRKRGVGPFTQVKPSLDQVYSQPIVERQERSLGHADCNCLVRLDAIRTTGQENPIASRDPCATRVNEARH